MNKIIEIFKWGYEGEYWQYFFIVDMDKESEFVEKVNVFLEKVQVHEEFFWSDPLDKFIDYPQVSISFSKYNTIQHIKDCYFLREHGSRIHKLQHISEPNC